MAAPKNFSDPARVGRQMLSFAREPANHCVRPTLYRIDGKNYGKELDYEIAKETAWHAGQKHEESRVAVAQDIGETVFGPSIRSKDQGAGNEDKRRTTATEPA